ncbi:MAG: DUF1566 domain-containing protein [Bacteroidales bacterium]|nr:DUF1566 domain-containing protein [Bacteroidales bacterium]
MKKIYLFLTALLLTVAAGAQTFKDWTSTNGGTNNSSSQNSYGICAFAGCTFTFDWSVSSESNYDWLIVTLDGTQILKKSGTASGTYTHEFTESGVYTFVAQYTKDYGGSSGSDQAKIINATITIPETAGKKGDVDGDGTVDVADVTEVVNIILNPDSDDDTPTTDSRAVDLGLPSGLKWASCNVGATKPEEYGGYYAWGETEEKSDYSWSTYKYCNGTFNSMTKYCTSSSYGTVDNKTTLEAGDDVASVKWGGSWRMPTDEEQRELINNCTWTWTTLNGVEGYRVTGPNGNSIFLPAAGYRGGTGGTSGYYWSSSLCSSRSYYAYYLYFYSGYFEWYNDKRSFGYSVRPVCP